MLFKEKITTRLDLLSIPQSGGKNVKTFRWDHRLQIQNLFMAFKRVPLWCLKKNQNAPRPSEHPPKFSFFGECCCLKKNQNAPRPSEHPSAKGEKMSKRLDGITGCKYKTSSWHLNGFPDGNNIGSTVYDVGEKPTVIPYTTYINRHAGTPEEQ